MKIRPFKKSDAIEIAMIDKIIQKEGLLDVISPRNPKDILKYWNNGKNRLFYVAESDNKIFGYLAGNLETQKNSYDIFVKRGESFFEIIFFYVFKEYRHKNIGTKLMHVALNAAKSRGIKKFKITAASKNLNTITEFYKKFGFKPYATKMRMIK